LQPELLQGGLFHDKKEEDSPLAALPGAARLIDAQSKNRVAVSTMREKPPKVHFAV
jgi:hypothetical protein